MLFVEGISHQVQQFNKCFQIHTFQNYEISLQSFHVIAYFYFENTLVNDSSDAKFFLHINSKHS